MEAGEVDAPLGVPLLHQDDRHSRRSGNQNRVEQSGHMGQWRRHKSHIRRGESVSPGHRPGFVGQAPMGVEHGLGVPARPRGEQDHGHVGPPGRTGGDRWAGEQVLEPDVVVAHADGVDQASQRLTGRTEGQRRSEVVEHPGHLGRTHLVMDGRSHRAQPPAGPEQHQSLPPVGQLPRHHIAPADAEPTEAPCGRGHQLLESAGIDGHVPVHHSHARGIAGGRQQGVECGHVPGSPGLPVARGAGLPVGGAEPHVVTSGEAPTQRAGTGPSTASFSDRRTGGAVFQLAIPSCSSATGYLDSWISAQCEWLS